MADYPFAIVANGFEFDRILIDEDFRDSVGAIWVRARTGNRWALTLTYNNAIDDKRRALWAEFNRVRGLQHRLIVDLPAVTDYQRTGAGGGTPLLQGAVSAGATSLPIDGAANNAQWLVAGDFIDVGNELKIVLEDVATSGGSGTIPIWPEVHQNQANNTPVEIDSPNGKFRVTGLEGLGAAPSPYNWLSPQVVATLEEDVRA